MLTASDFGLPSEGLGLGFRAPVLQFKARSDGLGYAGLRVQNSGRQPQEFKVPSEFCANFRINTCPVQIVSNVARVSVLTFALYNLYLVGREDTISCIRAASKTADITKKY